MVEYAVLITALIMDRPTCLACLVAKTELGPASVQAYLEDVARKVLIRHDTDEPCRTCGHAGNTVAIRGNRARPST